MHRLRATLCAIVAALFVMIAWGTHATTMAQGVISYNAGWNLIAGPAGSHVQGAVGDLLTWQAGDSSYETVPAGSALKGCTAYWAYFPNGGSLAPAPDAAICTVTVTPGQWVLAGGPSSQTAATLSGDYVAYGYTPVAGYRPVPIVPVGRGVWLTGTGAVTLSVGSGTGSAP